MGRNTSKVLEMWANKIAKKNHDIALPVGFEECNTMIGNPKHPNTGDRTKVFDFQVDYFNAVRDHHKVILDKSRKIGATETALRIIAYNCFDHYDKNLKLVERSKYAGHVVMIVAGNKQSVANGFIRRFRQIFEDGFTDMRGNYWSKEEILFGDASNRVELFNGVVIEAYPASEAVRGEANVICVFMSESAFIKLLDDSVVYKAVRPNISNIENADFILESTPNGKRGFFYEIWDKAHQTPPTTDFYPLFQPYTVAMGKILFEDDIERMKVEYTKDFFEQEYCGLFTTSGNAAFKEDEIVFEEDKGIDYFEDI